MTFNPDTDDDLSITFAELLARHERDGGDPIDAAVRAVVAGTAHAVVHAGAATAGAILDEARARLAAKGAV